MKVAIIVLTIVASTFLFLFFLKKINQQKDLSPIPTASSMTSGQDSSSSHTATDNDANKNGVQIERKDYFFRTPQIAFSFSFPTDWNLDTGVVMSYQSPSEVDGLFYVQPHTLISAENRVYIVFLLGKSQVQEPQAFTSLNQFIELPNKSTSEIVNEKKLQLDDREVLKRDFFNKSGNYYFSEYYIFLPTHSTNSGAEGYIVVFKTNQMSKEIAERNDVSIESVISSIKTF